MIEKYESSWEYDCSSTPEAWTHNCYMLVNFVEGLKNKINELVDTVNKQQQQLNNHLSKTVIQTQNGKFIAFYNGIREAERQTGINHHRISECCRGNTRTAGGYEWQYSTKGGDNE